MRNKRIVVGITGASGVVYGIRVLELLHGLAEVEVHLVVSSAAKRVIGLETCCSIKEIEALAYAVYCDTDIAAPIASGSFGADAMIIVPCSVKTLSAVANSYSSTLISRAADVSLKQRRNLILCIRETPFHCGHLRLMLQASESGAVICPPVPDFYSQPELLQDLIDQTAAKLLDLVGVECDCLKRWNAGGSEQKGHSAHPEPRPKVGIEGPPPLSPEP